MVLFSNKKLFVAFFKKTIEINTKINTLKKIYIIYIYISDQKS